MTSFQTTADIDKARDKCCPLSFMHIYKIGLLTLFAKINRRGGLNMVRSGGKKNLKINKRLPSCIKHPRVG